MCVKHTNTKRKKKNRQRRERRQLVSPRLAEKLTENKDGLQGG